ncbi:hypothetical protein QN399_18130 [Pseudomonas sp. 10C3]|jgi:hypothetical protein|uniref:hypothetical protein n=1 Tax=Pseudomonas sp. 10C3 TaxID=3118753 RepID=UPI002E8135BB|nr:hypothetical protein [Pseudomonas sp. 10C3]MEE3508159.1 hypothetical protein [Pseudomonas sp. 10C3]
MQQRFGRIQLSRIVPEWDDEQPINPRMLAGEVADVLRTLMPVDHLIHSLHASVTLSASTTGDRSITYGALADYFESASLGQPAETISTSAGPVQTAAVVIWRQWIGTITIEATSRALMVAGYAMPANDTQSSALIVGGHPSRSHFAPAETPSGSEEGYLKMRQTTQRQEGEKTAARDIFAEREKSRTLEQRVMELLAQSAIDKAQSQQFMDEAEQSRRDTSSERRARLKAEDELIRIEELLEPHMLAIEFLNPDNPLSPPEIREMFQCWICLTKDNEREPVKATSKGMDVLCRDWFKAQGEDVTGKKLSRFATALNSEDRKKGGAVARP